MKLKYFSAFLTLILTFSVSSQSVNNDVLFTIENDSIYASEFIKVYQKNLDLIEDESQKDIDEYLKLFTTYKLKVKEAKNLGFHEKPQYKKEFERYKTQLSKNYISETKVTDALIKEAYQRVLLEVNANHILVKIDENASPEDTLVAYNQILKIRDRAINEGFEKVRKEVHDGKSIYGEELGYFSGFTMVYEFENVAYNTEIDEVSMPFRTRFGYHILNVIDKRTSEGEREVAHIMISLPKNAADSIVKNKEKRIQEIYSKIHQGENFEALAKQFSEEKQSASIGGKLRAFKRGQLRVQEFEDVAFGLKNVGDISEPFKTSFGWHIVKLHDKKLVPDFETIKPELVTKIERDSRSKLIDKSLVDSLKKQYHVIDNQEALMYFESVLNDNYFNTTWELPNHFTKEKMFLEIGDKQFSYHDFGEYLLKTQRRSNQKKNMKTLVNEKYQDFLKDKLIEYKKDVLEKENDDFAFVLNEYREGLLLFDLMENTIWNAGTTDSIAVKKYYETNKEKYIFPKRIDAVVASSVNKKALKKVGKYLKNNKSIEEIKSLVNNDNNINVIFTSDTLDITHQVLPKGFELKKGISKVLKSNEGYVVVQVKDVFPSTQKTFEEAKGIVISDYQDAKEEKWINSLRDKYKVLIDEKILEKIKKQLN